MKHTLYVRPSQFEALEERIAPAVFMVTTALDGGNQGGLRAAVERANINPGADTVAFDPLYFATPRTITLTAALGAISITDSVNIKGLGPDIITVDGDDATRIFLISDDLFPTPKLQTVSISGLSLTGGKALLGEGSGGAISSTESLNLTNMVLTDNHSPDYGGGAIDFFSPGSLFIKDSRIVDNSSQYAGGAIAATAGKISIINSLLSGNSNTYVGGSLGGGAILNLSAGPKASLLIENSVFQQNSTTGYGGGVFIGNSADKAKITIKNSTFSSNEAKYGGGIYLDGLGTSTESHFILDRVTIAHNVAQEDGGGLISYGGAEDTLLIKNSQFLKNFAKGGGGMTAGGDQTVTLQNTLLSGNTAIESGGGASIYSKFFNAKNLTVAGNSAVEDGGGILLTGVTANISSSSFTANSAGENGGGLSATTSLLGPDPASHVTVSKASFSGNIAGTGSGGGFFIKGGSTLDLQGSVLTGNYAAGSGGGASLSYSGNSSISKSTFSGNIAAAGGGLSVQISSATLSIQSSTFSGNTAMSSAGGIYASLGLSSTATITSSTIEHNSAGNVGGGLLLEGPGSAAFVKSNILNNVSVNSGGGISVGATPLTLTGGIVSGNISGDKGGGIYHSSVTLPVPAISGTKVTGNSADILATSNFGGYIFGLVLPPTVSTKGTYIVNDIGDTDDGVPDNGTMTLREAINLANASGKAASIGFDATLAYQTITLATALPTITQSLTINGLGMDKLAIDGNGANRIFTIDDSLGTLQKAVITGLTLKGGIATGSGGAILTAESLTLDRVLLTGNTADIGYGGGVFSSDGTLIVKNSAVIGNISDLHGGGISSNSSDVQILHSLISGNTAGNGTFLFYGGGVFADFSDTKSSLLIDKSAILSNTASRKAGGIGVQSEADQTSVVIKNTIVSGNTAGTDGGGISLSNAETIGTGPIALSAIVDNVILAHNSADVGGGLDLSHAIGTTLADSLIIKNSKFLLNQATAGSGGGINIANTAVDQNVSMQSSIVGGNTASLDGGGIHGGHVALVVKGAIFVDNEAGQDGAAINVNNFSNADISGSKFLAGTANRDGGGFHADNSVVTMKGNTFAANESTRDGGAISTTVWTQLSLSNSSITGNRSDGKGGGLSGINTAETTLTKNTFTANHSTDEGGGVYIKTNTGNFVSKSDKFIANSSANKAGGLFAYIDSSHTAILTGALISKNRSNDQGGGLFLDGMGSTTVNMSKILNNISGNDGGGLFLNSGILTLNGGQISGNFASYQGGGTFINTGATSTNNGTKVFGNFAPIDPNVGP